MQRATLAILMAAVLWPSTGYGAEPLPSITNSSRGVLPKAIGSPGGEKGWPRLSSTDGGEVTQARANLETMIDRILAANKSCEIILMVMNPPIGVHLERRPKIEDYYQMYRDVAKERKLLLVDHYVNWEPILKKDKDLFNKYVPDGIHPGDEGCTKVITPAILKRLGMRDE